MDHFSLIFKTYVNAKQEACFKIKTHFKAKEPCLEKHRPSTKCPPRPLFLRHCEGGPELLAGKVLADLDHLYFCGFGPAWPTDGSCCVPACACVCVCVCVSVCVCVCVCVRAVYKCPHCIQTSVHSWRRDSIARRKGNLLFRFFPPLTRSFPAAKSFFSRSFFYTFSMLPFNF